MDETSLINQLIKATGLPENSVKTMLTEKILEKGKSPRDLDLDDLKDIMVHLLQEFFCDVKEGRHDKIKISR